MMNKSELVSTDVPNQSTPLQEDSRTLGDLSIEYRIGQHRQRGTNKEKWRTGILNVGYDIHSKSYKLSIHPKWESTSYAYFKASNEYSFLLDSDVQVNKRIFGNSCNAGQTYIIENHQWLTQSVEVLIAFPTQQKEREFDLLISRIDQYMSSREAKNQNQEIQRDGIPSPTSTDVLCKQQSDNEYTATGMLCKQAHDDDNIRMIYRNSTFSVKFENNTWKVTCEPINAQNEGK